MPRRWPCSLPMLEMVSIALAKTHYVITLVGKWLGKLTRNGVEKSVSNTNLLTLLLELGI